MNTELLKWPPYPYKGLGYYESDDIPLFAGRDIDIQKCSALVVHRDTQCLILHGKTGCGKSSFLRAGLIPTVEKEGFGFEFLKDKADSKYKALFIRCTDAPLDRLAESLYEFIEGGYDLITPIGRTKIDLEDALQNKQKLTEFRKNARKSEFLLKTLYILSSKLPRTLIIILDQAEEVITLSEDIEDNKRHREFFQFMREFNAVSVDIKIIISLRTEYYGRFIDSMQPDYLAKSNVKFYLLKDLTVKKLEEAIVRPTSRDSVKTFGIPYKYYRFEFEEGLPETIASDLMKSKQSGGVLPIMQIVCSKLYELNNSIKKLPDIWTTREDYIITHEDYGKLGKVEGIIDKHISESLQSICENLGLKSSKINDECNKWRLVLSKLVSLKADGSVATDFIEKAELIEMAKNENVQLDAGEVLQKLADDQRLILKTFDLLNFATGKKISYCSLGHDIIGLSIHKWLVSFEETKELNSSIKFFRLQRNISLLAAMLGMLLVVTDLISKFSNPEIINFFIDSLSH